MMSGFGPPGGPNGGRGGGKRRGKAKFGEGHIPTADNVRGQQLLERTAGQLGTAIVEAPEPGPELDTTQPPINRQESQVYTYFRGRF
jgi:hypothetical protein